MNEHISFGSVESLHNKVKDANRYYHAEQLFYVKPKLHGTNASIVVNGDRIYAQSRKNVLTTHNDNAGFANWVDTLIIKPGKRGITSVVYGEWAGSGIQKNDAVTMIGRKVFFVICIRIIDNDTGKQTVQHDPIQITDTIFEMGLFDHQYGIIVIPTIAEFDISLSGNVEHLGHVETAINLMVSAFETVDPYIKSEFNVEGPGEGIVAYPDTNDWLEYHNLMFKAKTVSHSVNKSKQAASAKVQISPDVQDFADRFATMQRFEQGITDLGIDVDMKNMGSFIKWVNTDIFKESKDEVEESELAWKECSRVITHNAKMWFMQEARRIT